MDRADVAIEQWARERPDLSSLPMAVLGRLCEAAERLMRDHLNPLFADAGLAAGVNSTCSPRSGESGAPICRRPHYRLYEAAMRSHRAA